MNLLRIAGSVASFAFNMIWPIDLFSVPADEIYDEAARRAAERFADAEAEFDVSEAAEGEEPLLAGYPGSHALNQDFSESSGDPDGAAGKPDSLESIAEEFFGAVFDGASPRVLELACKLRDEIHAQFSELFSWRTSLTSVAGEASADCGPVTETPDAAPTSGCGVGQPNQNPVLSVELTRLEVQAAAHAAYIAADDPAHSFADGFGPGDSPALYRALADKLLGAWAESVNADGVKGVWVLDTKQVT